MTDRSDRHGLVAYRVGAPWPHAHPGGMLAILEPGGEAGLDVTLVAALDRPTEIERAAIEGPLRVAIHPSPPLVWFCLSAGRTSFDAPYAAAIGGEAYEANIRSGAARASAMSDTLFGLVTFVILDRGHILKYRVATLSRPWWRALAAGLAAAPPSITRQAYQDAITTDQRARTTAQMIEAATAVEIAGRVA